MDVMTNNAEQQEYTVASLHAAGTLDDAMAEAGARYIADWYVYLDETDDHRDPYPTRKARDARTRLNGVVRTSGTQSDNILRGLIFVHSEMSRVAKRAFPEMPAEAAAAQTLAACVDGRDHLAGHYRQLDDNGGKRVSLGGFYN